MKITIGNDDLLRIHLQFLELFNESQNHLFKSVGVLPL